MFVQHAHLYVIDVILQLLIAPNVTRDIIYLALLAFNVRQIVLHVQQLQLALRALQIITEILMQVPVYIIALLDIMQILGQVYALYVIQIV